MDGKYLSIQEYLGEYERHRVKFEDKSTLLAWLFEYACQTAQYEGIDPAKHGKYLERLVQQKLDDVLPIVKQVYEEYDNYTYFFFPTPSKDLIPDLVRQEHMMGKKS